MYLKKKIYNMIETHYEGTLKLNKEDYQILMIEYDSE
jgi:hypothetical protein